MNSKKPKQGYKLVKSFFGKNEEIPTEWEYTKLSNLAEKKNDIVAGPFGSNLKVSDYKSSGVPIIRLQNIERNRFIDKNIQYISKEKAEELSYHSYQPKDIILAKLGDPIGKTCRVPETFPAGIVVADVVRIRTSPKKADTKYVEYILNSNLCEKQHNKERIGTTRPRVNLEQIRDLRFPCPPLKEQQKIASILSNVDSLINQTQKEIEQTQRLKKGLMQKLLTKGIGHIKLKKVNFGGQIDAQIPEEWDVVTIEEISVDGTQNGLAISISDYGKGIPIVGMTKFYASEILSLDNMNEVSISEKDKENFSLRSFDLLFGRRSMDGKATGGAGKCVIIPELKSAIVFESSIIRMSVKKGINPFFIYQLLKSQFGKQLMIRIIRVSAVSGISSGDLRKIKVPIPPKQEQDEIVEILDNFDSQIQRQQQYKSKLEILKKGLMQKLLTGQIRVKVWVLL